MQPIEQGICASSAARRRSIETNMSHAHIGTVSRSQATKKHEVYEAADLYPLRWFVRLF